MANEANPLLSLSSEKQQQIVDLVDNGNIGEIAEKGGMTRRQVLQVAVALGAGATVGGYSIDQIIGEARAAADTSDSDGNVGLPGDRVDVFAEGVDVSGEMRAGSLSTDDLDIGGDLPTGFQTLYSATGPNNQNILYKNFYSQAAVEQTKKTIFDQVVGGSAASVLVIGRDTSNNRFFDRVDYFGFGSATDTELTTRGTPANRDYAVNRNTLKLSVASDSFNVTAIGDEINTTEP